MVVKTIDVLKFVSTELYLFLVTQVLIIMVLFLQTNHIADTANISVFLKSSLLTIRNNNNKKIAFLSIAADC